PLHGARPRVVLPDRLRGLPAAGRAAGLPRDQEDQAGQGPGAGHRAGQADPEGPARPGLTSGGPSRLAALAPQGPGRRAALGPQGPGRGPLRSHLRDPGVVLRSHLRDPAVPDRSSGQAQLPLETLRVAWRPAAAGWRTWSAVST